MSARIAEYAATPARRRTLAAIAVTFIIFAGLAGYMLYLRFRSADWQAPFEFGSLLMIFAMAMAGICGSITMEVAASRVAAGETEEPMRWAVIAVSGWLVFLFLELVEWVYVVYWMELGPETPFGRTYLALTGAHWLAVIVCTIWFTIVAFDVKRRDIRAAALYSHFLALWWLVLIVMLYFPNMHPLVDL